MKKVMVWVAVTLMIAGIALFTVVGFAVDFNFMRLDTMKYVTNSYDITEQFDSIDIDTLAGDVEFRPSQDGTCRVECYEREKLQHDVSVSNGTLMVLVDDTRSWLDHISIFNFNIPKITVYLPESNFATLKVDNTAGDMSLCGKWSFDNIKVDLTTGTVKLSEITCTNEISVHVTTGDIRMDNVNCQNLMAKGTTGEAVLKNVIASGTMQIKRTTGNIKLDNCDAGEMYISTVTGNVNGTLLTPKVISAKATTGSVDVPTYTTGGRCDISTTTGNIRIKIG